MTGRGLCLALAGFVIYLLRMKEIISYPGCFVCGQKNEIGLKASFFWDGRKAICNITADELYAGYKDVFHGGIIATLLDEVMIKALLAENIFCVTAEMTVRFRKPVHSGESLRFEGWATAKSAPLFLTSGHAVNQKGETVAEATGKYLTAKNELSQKLLESLQ